MQVKHIRAMTNKQLLAGIAEEFSTELLGYIKQISSTDAAADDGGDGDLSSVDPFVRGGRWAEYYPPGRSWHGCCGEHPRCL